mmetsp:Transcript_17711/g.24993  ORF Transcript_17711/g.24993 Transcript_17711/m.24993 type:complete len:233 (-) Transcript_17711:106-804(-)|eukprot:CAMPEP_0184863206 /NCGR_PEP_ID=MMETSP0580-20130426/9785_1 /TAXON_ID=1118495 /ORGANISM="Dactyliosolen fragilissimus" /LENGTH=232 /DNA_ID=CAMNT_0027361397 /DNA_START=40 /DNA_END=738 /DNA_ORIENTATION=-
MTSTPKLTLTYFPIGGRAEAIRLAAAAGGVCFSNKVVSFPEFVAMKDSLPLGQLPVLEIESSEGEKSILTESDGILRYFGKISGLYPTDNVKAMEVDAILGVLEDLSKPMVTTVGGAVRNLLSETEWTTEEKLAIRKRCIETNFPRFLGFIENKIKASDGPWVVGDAMTVADLKIFASMSWYQSGVLDGVPTDVLSAYPSILKLMDAVMQNEGIKNWKDKYSIPYPSFDFEP